MLNVSSRSAVAPAWPAEPVDGAQPATLRRQARTLGDRRLVSERRVRPDRVVQQDLRTPEIRELLYPWHPWFALWVAVHEAIDKSDGVVFRCSLSGSDAGRWLEVPAWMFDRSACARARIATDAYADLAALTTLATLLRHTLNDHFASSNAPVSGGSKLSRDQNRGEVYATPDKADNGAPPRAAGKGRN